MNKNKFYIAIFFVMCLIPLLTMFIPGMTWYSNNEGVMITPQLFDHNKIINVNYPNELCEYFNKRIGLRKQMITIYNRLYVGLFGESPNKDVIVGKKGWLFYGKTLDDYEGINCLSDKELRDIAKTLSLMDENCNLNNKDFLFTIAPNKNSIYPEFMPNYYIRGKNLSDAKRLKKFLDINDVEYADLISEFEKEDKILYRKTDSHWTNEGSGLAADIILKSFETEHKKYYGNKTKVINSERGDLFDMIYPNMKDMSTDVKYTDRTNFIYSRPIRSVEDNFIYTSSQNNNGNLLMFRDSFGNSLHLFMADTFDNACFTRIMPYDLNLATENNSDKVLVEIVERNLNMILLNPPIFDAPQRDIHMSDCENITSNVSIHIEQFNSSEEYFKVGGKLPDSYDYDNIYISVGEQIFEATPAADNGFVAYISSKWNLDEIQILIAKDDNDEKNK